MKSQSTSATLRATSNGGIVNNFNELLDSSLNELVATVGFRINFSASDLSLEEFYAACTIAFLRGEMDRLNHLCAEIPTTFSHHPEREFLETACALRSRIRDREAVAGLFSRALKLAAAPSAWQVELLLLVATLHTTQNEYAPALGLFAQAAKAFHLQGCPRKSLRAEMNAIVCESNLHPNKNLFTRYHDLFRRTLRLRSHHLPTTLADRFQPEK